MLWERTLSYHLPRAPPTLTEGKEGQKGKQEAKRQEGEQEKAQEGAQEKQQKEGQERAQEKQQEEEALLLLRPRQQQRLEQRRRRAPFRHFGEEDQDEAEAGRGGQADGEGS